MSSVAVRVRIGREHYALGVEDVLEVAELGEVTPMPGGAAYVLGVRNLRGQVLPVIDLAALLGIPREGSAPRLVVAERDGLRAGLSVDELEDVGALPEIAEPSDSPFLHGATLLEGVPIGVVDLGAVLEHISTASPAA